MENIRLAFQGIWSHKLRSVLTMLGIIIGIASIITIVSTIKGTNEQIKQNLVGAGNNVVNVQLYESNYPYDMAWNGVPQGVSVIPEVKRSELEALEGVEAVAFFRARQDNYGECFFENTQFTGSIYGIDRHFLSVEGYQLLRGRMFMDADYKNHRKVLLMDEKAADSLFGDADPIGQVMELRGETFTVIGVVGSTNSFTPKIQSLQDYYLYADISGGSLFMPDGTWPVVYQFDEPQSVAVKAVSTDYMTKAGKAVADALTASQIQDGQTVGEEGASRYAYRSEDLLEQAQQLQEMSNAANQQLLWIASISLLVGGIGVMNIMLVSVTERTAEIGLKKALGAKKRRILGQFLTEASVLTCLGGILGVAAGIGLAELVSRLNGLPVRVSIPAAAIAVGFSTLIGVLFGSLPAIKAANLNPIDALRRE